MCYPQLFYDQKEVQKIFGEAEQEVHRIENKLTDFRPSPFNLINENAGKSPVPVDKEIFDLIKKSIDFSISSKGVFDISFATLGHLWRKQQKIGQSLDSKIVEKLKKYIDYRQIILNEKERSVFLPFPEMKIGLGGLGKGYAVDQVYEFLVKHGLQNFYVEGSGDIRVHSSPTAPRKWRVSVRNPFSSDSSKSMGVIQLGHGAVATSGGYIHRVKSKSNKLDHHIIHPKMGESTQQLISVTILAVDAITADSLGTIMMNYSGRDAISELDKKGLIGFVVTREGKCLLSKKAYSHFGM